MNTFEQKKYKNNKKRTYFLNSFNPELQLKDTESAIKNKLQKQLSELRGFKFVTTLVLVLKKRESEDKIKFDNFHSSSKAETLINESDIDDVFESIYSTVISNTQKSLGKGSDWIIDSVIHHTISISKYNPLAGNSYIKLPKELDHPRKELINIQNTDDNEWFKWCLVRYLNPANHHLARITNTDKEFAKTLDFKDTKFPVKIIDIQKIDKKKNSLGINVCGYDNKEKYPIYVSKQSCEEKHVDLLLTGEEGKINYILIKDFNIFMYDHTLHRGRKHFCHYCLQASSAQEILKTHTKDCFKINCEKRIILPKESEFVKFKNYERKIKSPFMIYADFESNLVPEDDILTNIKNMLLLVMVIN